MIIIMLVSTFLSLLKRDFLHFEKVLINMMKILPKCCASHLPSLFGRLSPPSKHKMHFLEAVWRKRGLLAANLPPKN
jgi:hypothetical protein